MLQVPKPGSGKPVQVIAVSDPHRMNKYIREMITRSRGKTERPSEQVSARSYYTPIDSIREAAFWWEVPRARGTTFILHYLRTWKDIVFNSKEAFEKALSKEMNTLRSFVFAWASVSAGLTGHMLLSSVLVNLAHDWIVPTTTAIAESKAFSNATHMLLTEPALTIALWGFLVPFFTPFLLVLWVSVIWLAMKIGRNIPPTFEKLAQFVNYASAPMVFMALPIFGPFIALPWLLYTTRNSLLFYEGDGVRLEFSLPVVLFVTLSIVFGLLFVFLQF